MVSRHEFERVFFDRSCLDSLEDVENVHVDKYVSIRNKLYIYPITIKFYNGLPHEIIKSRLENTLKNKSVVMNGREGSEYKLSVGEFVINGNVAAADGRADIVSSHPQTKTANPRTNLERKLREDFEELERNRQQRGRSGERVASGGNPAGFESNDRVRTGVVHVNPALERDSYTFTRSR